MRGHTNRHTSGAKSGTFGSMRRVLFLVLVLGVLAGATAIAQTGGTRDAYELQEPSVTSRAVLRLPSDAGCIRFTRATVRFLPPPGAVFGVLTVTANGREATRMTGVPRAASTTIRLSGARTAVRVSGTTLGGQVVHAERTYRRCGAARRRSRRPRRSAPRPAPPRRPSSPAAAKTASARFVRLGVRARRVRRARQRGQRHVGRAGDDQREHQQPPRGGDRAPAHGRGEVLVEVVEQVEHR